MALHFWKFIKDFQKLLFVCVIAIDICCIRNLHSEKSKTQEYTSKHSISP